MSLKQTLCLDINETVFGVENVKKRKKRKKPFATQNYRTERINLTEFRKIDEFFHTGFSFMGCTTIARHC